MTPAEKIDQIEKQLDQKRRELERLERFARETEDRINQTKKELYVLYFEKRGITG